MCRFNGLVQKWDRIRGKMRYLLDQESGYSRQSTSGIMNGILII
jgi:hypothetical protein